MSSNCFSQVLAFPSGAEALSRPVPLIKIISDRNAEPSGNRAAILKSLEVSGSLPAKDFFEKQGRRHPVRERIGEIRTRRSINRLAYAAVTSGSLSPIALHRMKVGLTQAQLAARLGVAQSQIARWESLEFDRISVGSLRKLARGLNSDVRDFFLRGHE